MLARTDTANIRRIRGQPQSTRAERVNHGLKSTKAPMSSDSTNPLSSRAPTAYSRDDGVLLPYASMDIALRARY
eukprot:12403439-Karenia_brevis.AAC.1